MTMVVMDNSHIWFDDNIYTKYRTHLYTQKYLVGLLNRYKQNINWRSIKLLHTIIGYRYDNVHTLICSWLTNYYQYSRKYIYISYWVTVVKRLTLLQREDLNIHSTKETFLQDFPVILKQCFRITRKSWRNIFIVTDSIVWIMSNDCHPNLWSPRSYLQLDIFISYHKK